MIDTELTKRYQFVKKFIKKNNYTDQFLIFLKTLNSVINSINYLSNKDTSKVPFKIQHSSAENPYFVFISDADRRSLASGFAHTRDS